MSASFDKQAFEDVALSKLIPNSKMYSVDRDYHFYVVISGSDATNGALQ